MNIIEISDDQLTTMAQNSGFMHRKPKKIDACNFLNILCLQSTIGTPSYNDLAARFATLTNVSASKQAFWKRVDEKCVLYCKFVLEEIIRKRVQHIDLDAFKTNCSFKRVIIQDSTIIKLPSRLFSVFSGVSNAHKKVCNARIQCVYELLSGSFLHFSIDPYSKNDLTAAPEIELQEDDLVLRDRGYCSFSEIRRHITESANFIFRHRYNFVYLDPVTNQPIDLKKLLSAKGSIDMEVCLNDKNKTKLRLVAQPVSQEIADERRRKAKKEMKGHKPSQNFLFLMSWTIFITTVPMEKADFNDIMSMYRLRWRIEIIFKIMKSHMNFDKIHNVSYNQLHAILVSRFITIILCCQYIFLHYYYKISKKFCKQLSMIKLIKYLQKNPEVFLKISKDLINVGKNEELMLEPIARYCTYDKRKRLNFHQLLYLTLLS